MPTSDKPDLTLFLDIVHTLERIGAPHMIIGGFAATMYGITRTTFDIDIVVDLKETHIQALAAAYPPPRYYADPEQMRSSIRMGISFNVIDGKRGEKADLSPLTRDSRYRQAFGRRIRYEIKWPGEASFDEAYLDAQAQALGPDVAELWQSIKQAAQSEARRDDA